MFRFLFARRGKGNISPPVKTQRNPQLATENIDMPTTRTFDILRPVILVSAALSGYTHPRYRILGIVGGFVWLTMLLAHGTLDFLAARQVYTYGWASVSLNLVLLCFVCTIFTNKRMLPWLEKGMSKLEDEQRYPKTLERCAKVFKVREWSFLRVEWLSWLEPLRKCTFIKCLTHEVGEGSIFKMVFSFGLSKTKHQVLPFPSNGVIFRPTGRHDVISLSSRCCISSTPTPYTLYILLNSFHSPLRDLHLILSLKCQSCPALSLILFFAFTTFVVFSFNCKMIFQVLSKHPAIVHRP